MKRRHPMLAAAAGSLLLHLAVAAALSRVGAGTSGVEMPAGKMTETVILTESAWQENSSDEGSADAPDEVAPRPPPSTRDAISSSTDVPPPREPPADPLDASDAPPTAPTEPRRVVGLSFASTVVGDGPAFAVGNTRMGVTAPTATAPPTAAPLDQTMSGRQRVSDRAHLLGKRYIKPRRQDEARPIYPELLRKQGIEADVVVAVVIDPQGAVTEAAVLRPSAYVPFNQAAMAAARAQIWRPAMADGKPVGWRLQYTVRFRLEDA